MTNQKETWQDRFEKEFELPWHKETGYNLKNIKTFISSEIQLALSKQREEIIKKCENYIIIKPYTKLNNLSFEEEMYILPTKILRI